MDIKRTVLWAIFFVSAIMLFDNWQRDHGRPSMFFPNPTATQTAMAPAASSAGSAGVVPESGAASAAGTPGSPPGTPVTPGTSAEQPTAAGQLIHFSTDVYDG